MYYRTEQDIPLYSHPRIMNYRIKSREQRRVKEVILLLNRLTDTDDYVGSGQGHILSGARYRLIGVHSLSALGTDPLG